MCVWKRVWVQYVILHPAYFLLSFHSYFPDIREDGVNFSGDFSFVSHHLPQSLTHYTYSFIITPAKAKHHVSSVYENSPLIFCLLPVVSAGQKVRLLLMLFAVIFFFWLWWLKPNTWLGQLTCSSTYKKHKNIEQVWIKCWFELIFESCVVGFGLNKTSSYCWVLVSIIT